MSTPARTKRTLHRTRPRKPLKFEWITAMGKYLREGREERKLSRKQLAAMAKLGKHGETYLKRYENGSNAPSLENLFPICQCLGIQVDELQRMLSGLNPTVVGTQIELHGAL